MHNPVYLRVGGGESLLDLEDESLVELISGAKARHAYLDIFAPRQKTHHRVGEVDDAYRFTHVEDEDVAAFCEGACLHHQLGRLLHSHEVPLDIRVGHQHRPAGLYLLLEHRHHAPARAQHVAEALAR